MAPVMPVAPTETTPSQLAGRALATFIESLPAATTTRVPRLVAPVMAAW